MANAKSEAKNPATKTPSRAQAKSSKAKSSSTTPSVAGKSEPKSSSAKAPDEGIVRFGPATKSGKPPDKASSRGNSKKSDDRSAKETDADVAESAKIDPPPPDVAEPDKAMSPEEAERARKSYLLKRFWVTARGFWGKSGDRIAWVASVGLLLLIILHVAAQYGINVWNRYIFDAIEKRDAATVLWLTGVFFPLAFASVAFSVAQVYARMGIQRRWRAWLTDNVVSRWLSNGRYYQLNLVAGDHKNPEYRIAEDLRIATEEPVDFNAGNTSALP